MPGAIGAPAASGADRSSRNFFDADGLLAGTLDGEGYLTAFTYTAAGQLAQSMRYATVTNAALRTSGTLAQLTPLAAAGDARTTHLYDGKGQRTATVDAEGYLTESIYDNSGNTTKTVRYANRVGVAVTSSSALAAIRPASSAQDRTTSRVYDALNRIAQETSPEGLRTTYTYDKLGNVLSTLKTAILPEETRSILAQYDLQGRRIAELSAQGAALLTAGQTQAQVDAIWAQHGLRHTYDMAGRRTSTTDAAGSRTLFYYNADDALTHTINALGEVMENRYDGQDRLVEQFAYTGRISTTGLNGGMITAALNSALTTVAGTQTLVARYTYTSDGRLATTTDAFGNVNRSTYNAFGEEIASEQSARRSPASRRSVQAWHFPGTSQSTAAGCVPAPPSMPGMRTA
jgi:YD repeat-containing protein